MNATTQTALDPVELLSRHLPSRPGCVHTLCGHDFPGYSPAIVQHESGNRWTIGLCSKWTYGKIQKALFCIKGSKSDVAAVLVEQFPQAAALAVGDEQIRLRWIAEDRARNIKAAARERAYTAELTVSLSKAMAKAGCKCRFLAELHTIQDSWGDYDGVAVYCDTQEGAERIAAWICKWEQARYEAKGGRYGGGAYDAQRCYMPRPMSAPRGVPFAVHASFRYYSIGD